MNPGNTVNSLQCPQCQTDNPLEARVCIRCRTSLAVVRAQHYLNLAEAEITNGRYDYARINLAQADAEMFSTSAEERKRHLLTARAFWLQGLTYFQKGEIDAARTELLLALENLEDLNDGQPLLAKVLNQLGNVAFYQRNVEAADYYQRSGEVASGAGEHAIAATALGNLGLIRAAEGRIIDSLVCYEQALAEATHSGDIVRVGATNRLLATLYASHGPFSRAIECIEKALALCGEINDPSVVCRITHDAGDVYFRYRDIEQAERWLRHSDEIANRLDYKILYSSNALILADLMRIKGDYPACLSYANRGYNQINLAPAKRSEATLALALYYLAVGNLPQAERYVQRLVEICAEQAPDSDQFKLVRARTLLFAAQGKWDEAEQSFQQAIKLAQTMFDKYEAANLQEEYASQLLSNVTAPQSTAIQARATSLLSDVTATYQQMEMPLRVARIEAMLNYV